MIWRGAVAFLVIALAFSTATRVAIAQDEAKTAADWIPPAAAFGTGWTQTPMTAVDLHLRANPDANVIRDQAVGVYLGPAGARVVVAVFLTAQDRTVTRQAWDEISILLFGAMLTTSPDEFLVDESPNLPDGCAEGQQQRGMDLAVGTIVTDIPVASTLCAVEPDVLILVETSGTINGDVGVPAANAVLTIILDGVE